jgi:hypothetical protein
MPSSSDDAFATIGQLLPRRTAIRRKHMGLNQCMLAPAERPRIKSLRVDPLCVDYNVLTTCCVCKDALHPTQIDSYLNFAFCHVSYMVVCAQCAVGDDPFVKKIGS